MLLRRVILAALLLGATAAPAQRPVIRFGTTADYPPFAQRTPDGTLIGADIVIARQVAAAMGARAEFVMTDWASLTSDLAKGRFDVAIGGLTVLPERAAIGTFSIPLIADGKRPLGRCGEQARYRTLKALDRPNVRIWINRGPGMLALAKDWFHRATVTIDPIETDLTAAVLDKRADVWITDGFVVDHMARRYRGRLCATTRKPFTHQSKAWLIRNDPQLVAAIDTQLKRALRSGAWLRALKAVP